MFLRYKYRLYPNKAQTELMKQFCGQQRWIWNHFLAEEIQTYEKTKKFRFYHKNAVSLPSLKNEYEWLKDGPSQSFQQTLLDLDKALKQSFKGKNNRKGFPKFQKKKNFQGSYRIVQAYKYFQETESYIKLPKLGKMKWKLHREIPHDFNTATIIQDGNQWYVSLVVKVFEEKLKNINNLNQVIGLDLNSVNLVVDSNGKTYTNPKYLKKSEKKLKRKQRQLAKSQNGSNNRRKKQLKLRTQHQKVKNQRNNHLHQISNQITNEKDLICLEDLNVKAMQKWNGRMVQDAGWSILVNQILYKALLKGKHTVKINRFAPSTKACSECGTIRTIKLSERTYICNECGHKEPRDLNAAKNIRNWGLDEFQNTVGTTEINACGDTAIGVELMSSARYVSMKQEAATL